MSSSNRELIQIEANEDANAVKDRLSFYRGKRVLLVWPEEGTALTRKLDLVLVQREAMRRQIRLAVVTHDAQVIRHARELNISAFETIGASERGRWKRGRAKVFTDRRQRPADAPEPDELKDVASRVASTRRGLTGLPSLLLRLSLLGVFLAAIAAVAYVIVPSATITLSPAEELIQTTITITISTDPAITSVDNENRVIPSLLVQVQVPEQEESTTATGSVAAGSDRAEGTVIFVNRTANAVEVPANTEVSTTDSSAVTFRTTQAVTVPAGVDQTVAASVIAAENAQGTAGNVPANTINTIFGPLEDQLDVRNPEPTTGGQRRMVSIVSEEDHGRLQRQMNQVIQARAFEEMPNAPGLTPRHEILAQTVRIEQVREDWVRYSHGVGDEANIVTLTQQARVSALAFDRQDAESLALLSLSALVPRGRQIQPATVNYEQGPVVEAADGTLSFDVTASSVVAGRVDEALLQERLAGISVDDAEAFILERVDIAEGTTPEIIVSPDLFGRMPILGQRITVEIREPQFAPGGVELEATTP